MAVMIFAAVCPVVTWQSTVAGFRRRAARRHHRPESVLATDLAGRREAAPVPRHHGTGVGAAQRYAGTAAGGGRVRRARGKVGGLPAGFRFHDLRHYFASLLIASGADIKTVQARVRHASAKNYS